ncbi:MerR family transcriptional regulator [Nocardia sp. alder85J]|uniref:MerR family transcriptional regulator n=1 Tax=Nocardia sp. alder85J TaxID=2862949 RepID=UPI001CD2EBC4|nr:MerR family transcriptional regulator [Nocardia sp. alder85J]MCX4097971.1 MerR family transcriptional regulator [Nocardia sp. alder85J]
MSAQLSIGEIARRSGVAATTLRYYEDRGLLRAPERVGGRRCYDESVLIRLRAIEICKASGFSLDEITVLLDDEAPGRPASRALGVAKLADIDARMAVLAEARSIIETGLRCTCPSLEACTCGVYPPVGTRTVRLPGPVG